FLACTGGAHDGLPCTGTPEDAGECGAGTCAPTACTRCATGIRAGAPCRSPADCPPDAPGGAPAACVPAGEPCVDDGDCAAGSECGPALFDFSTRLVAGQGPALVGGFVAQALDPVPLEGLVQS